MPFDDMPEIELKTPAEVARDAEPGTVQEPSMAALIEAIRVLVATPDEDRRAA